jgi:hypothetical protein
MKHKVYLLFPFLGIGIVHSQEVISSQGTVYQNPSGSISFTIGEVVIKPLTNTDGSILQGFQQPSWNFVGIDDINPVFEATVFPNPMDQNLSIQTAYFSKVHYQLSDNNGKNIHSGELLSESTQIGVANLAPGNYQLFLIDNQGKRLKTIHLIKTH